MLKKIWLFLLLKKLVFNYIVLPIKNLPKENYRSSYEINSPKDIINSEYLSTFFTELEMGEPPQKVPLLLKTEVSSYIITSINSIENCTSYKYVNTFNLSKSFFSIDNYTFYDEKKSNSFILNNCDYGRFYEACEQCNSNETFFFYQDIDLKEKTKAEKLYFELMRNVEDNITGEIGLNYYDRNKRSFNSFLEILKIRRLIEKYVWFFDCEPSGGKEGKIVIGSLPHEIYPDNYDSDDLVYGKSISNSFVIYWRMQFNKVYINLNNNNYYFNETTIEFKFDSNVIIGTSEYENYISNIFDKYITTGNCFNDTINDIKFYSNKYKFYYCKNSNDIKNQLYELLPKLHFYSNEFNYTFEIGNEELLKIENEYIYYKVLFNEKDKNSKVWYLGKPISLKYKFVFNPESKLIGFYKNYYRKESDNKPQGGNNLEIVIKILIIILLSFILIFLGIKIGKMIYGMKRKKRANELIDDYDYESHDNNKNQNNNVDNDNNNCINN